MNKKRGDLNLDKFLNFIEELSWLLDNYKSLKLEDSVVQIKDILEMGNLDIYKYNNLLEYKEKQVRSLVGIFPELFQNRSLFPTNQSIIEFANEVLMMNINPSKNRSKNEIIGEIVCSTFSLSGYEMDRVVNALNRMIDNDSVVKKVNEMKNHNYFSWNEVIQRLGE